LIKLNNEHKYSIPSEYLLNSWNYTVNKFLGLESKKSLALTIVSKLDMVSISTKYYKKSLLTNILSFPFIPPSNLSLSLEDKNFIGDIIICYDVILEESKIQRKTLFSHLCHLFIHGILHLLGYDHKYSSEMKQMEYLEVSILQKLGIDNPYILN